MHLFVQQRHFISILFFTLGKDASPGEPVFLAPPGTPSPCPLLGDLNPINQPLPGPPITNYMRRIMRKQTLRSLSLSYQEKDGHAWPLPSFFWYDSNFSRIWLWWHSIQSYQNKDGCAHACPSIFWYGNDKDLTWERSVFSRHTSYGYWPD